MDIESEIADIKARNARVETAKAWETSLFRMTLLAALIYVCAAAFLFVSGISNPFLGAVVPPLGYVLSSQSLPGIRKWWTKTFWKGKSPS